MNELWMALTETEHRSAHVVAADGSRVADVYGRSERQANARVRLIAAAPALLAALERCLPSQCQATSPASPQYAGGKTCGRCGYCLGLAAIQVAREQ